MLLRVFIQCSPCCPWPIEFEDPAVTNLKFVIRLCVIALGIAFWIWVNRQTTRRLRAMCERRCIRCDYPLMPGRKECPECGMRAHPCQRLSEPRRADAG